MKKLITLILTGVLLFSVGCSNNESKTSDNKFLKDIKKSFEARTAYLNDFDSGKVKVSENEALKEAVLKEKEIVGTYNDSEFENPELGKLAKDYNEGLNKQEESLKYYNSDSLKYDDLWSEGYNIRSVVLTKLVDDFGLKLDKKSIEDLKTNAQVVKENKDKEAKINEMLKNIKFEKVKDEYDWKDYEAIVENTSGQEFKSFFLNIKLKDSDGIIVDSPIASAENWKNGEKVKLTFSTDKNFEKIEWDAEYYFD